MATSWNPNTCNKKTQWNMQSSSSDNWTTLTNSKWKLLEHFVRHVAQSELKTKPVRHKKPQASDELKSCLMSELNKLVWNHLKPPLSPWDCHPKTSAPHMKMKERRFKGNIQLEVFQDKASTMTDDLLSKPFGRMLAHTHQLWLDDTSAGHYTVVKQKKEETPTQEQNEKQEEDDDEEVSEQEAE
ncbi:hypothetical protein DFH28DRAFT_882947 [Melampsora americana]|nr:hypothetical protein DFH28DRAFT_882947 [Melampsora americana]